MHNVHEIPSIFRTYQGQSQMLSHLPPPHPGFGSAQSSTVTIERGNQVIMFSKVSINQQNTTSVSYMEIKTILLLLGVQHLAHEE